MSQEHESVFALGDLAEAIGVVLVDNFPDPIWVVADVASLRVSGPGHAYLELVDAHMGPDGKPRTARMRAQIWKRQYGVIAFQFAQETGTALRAGLTLQCQVQVGYHVEYGLSLTILDIDTRQLIAQTSRQLDQVVAQLVSLGLTDRQRQLKLPTLCRRLAVISSASAAGLEDFIHQLSYNRAGYAFSYELFPSIMQGPGTSAGIVSALDRIAARCDEFDLVVMIRGGGAEVDLFAFDDLAIGQAIAHCPVPVLVGIGHARDRTVPDIVAHWSVKTPTAAAEALIERHALAEQALIERIERYATGVEEWLADQDDRLQALSHRLDRALQSRLAVAHQQQMRLGDRLTVATERYVDGQTHRLDLLAQRLEAADPAQLLDRGYTRLLDRQGQAVRRMADLSPGERVLAPLSDGVMALDVVGPVRLS